MMMSVGLLSWSVWLFKLHYALLREWESTALEFKYENVDYICFPVFSNNEGGQKNFSPARLS
jgi:hypothetical protein